MGSVVGQRLHRRGAGAGDAWGCERGLGGVGVVGGAGFEELADLGGAVALGGEFGEAAVTFEGGLIGGARGFAGVGGEGLAQGAGVLPLDLRGQGGRGEQGGQGA